MITEAPVTPSPNKLLIASLRLHKCQFGTHVLELMERMSHADYNDDYGPRSLFHTGIVAPTKLGGSWRHAITHQGIYDEAHARGYRTLTPFSLLRIVEGIRNDGSEAEFHQYLGMKPLETSFGVPMIFAVFKAKHDITIIARNATPHEIHGNDESWLFIR